MPLDPAIAAEEPDERSGGAHMACVAAILRMSGLRPTRPRLFIAARLIGLGRHVTAEALYDELRGDGLSLSLATVYNTLHQFQGAGLVRELAVDGMTGVYDTDTSGHHHFYFEHEGRIADIPAGALAVGRLPPVPPGFEISRVEVLVRLAPRPSEG